MASTPTFTPNPYANFDPSQWSNPYSNFQNSAIPFPATYSGWPTDASGNPIQPTPGMTLNSSPAAAAAPAPAAAAAPNPFANVQAQQGMNTPGSQQRGGLSISDWQALSPAQRTAAMGPIGQYQTGLAMMPSGNNFVASGSNPSGSNPQASTALGFMNSGLNSFAQMQQQPQQAAPAAPAVNNAGLTPQQYLQLRANPGHVTTPGATVPQAASSATPGPGMLQSFLANWNPATSGPGSGFQQAFSKALRGS